MAKRGFGAALCISGTFVVNAFVVNAFVLGSTLNLSFMTMLFMDGFTGFAHDHDHPARRFAP